MKIIVTGGAGFIGSHLVEELDKKHEVHIIDKKLSPTIDLASFNNLKDHLIKIKPQIIYDLVTLPLPLSLINPYFVAEELSQIINNLCELCRLGYYKTLIHISSSEAYGSGQYVPMDENHPLLPRTPYAAAKAAQDMIIMGYVNTFGIDARIVRCFNTYGARQHFSLGGIVPKTVNSILRGQQPEIYGDGSQSRDFTYVKDIVRGIIEAGNQKLKGKVINIGSGKQTSIKELVLKICTLMDYKDKPKYLAQRVADVTRHQADITLAKKLFNFQPQFSLEEGLKETIKYYVSNLSNFTAI